MKVLGLLSRKGGAGKTTLAVHLAVAAEQTGKRTLILDADPQRSAASWWQAREAGSPQMEAVEAATLPSVIEAARKAGMDLVVIDTRPSVEADAAAVAKLSDYLLIPTRPAILDLRAILGTLDIVKGSARKAAIVLNACPPTRGLSASAAVVREARQALKAFGVPVAAPTLTQRAAFSHALVAGLTVTEAEPDGKAALEVRALWKFVEKELFR
ncbi:AAA family ATPase [Roseomonas chloroacetimidivorans]|uniref:AAA family ATPase n=1 Tax=Roseomonas chloroacetimidivorans TaxID=1766656 RepID=UPI003C73E72B